MIPEPQTDSITSDELSTSNLVAKISEISAKTVEFPCNSQADGNTNLNCRSSEPLPKMSFSTELDEGMPDIMRTSTTVISTPMIKNKCENREFVQVRENIDVHEISFGSVLVIKYVTVPDICNYVKLPSYSFHDSRTLRDESIENECAANVSKTQLFANGLSEIRTGFRVIEIVRLPEFDFASVSDVSTEAKPRSSICPDSICCQNLGRYSRNCRARPRSIRRNRTLRTYNSTGPTQIFRRCCYTRSTRTGYLCYVSIDVEKELPQLCDMQHMLPNANFIRYSRKNFGHVRIAAPTASLGTVRFVRERGCGRAIHASTERKIRPRRGRLKSVTAEAQIRPKRGRLKHLVLACPIQPAYALRATREWKIRPRGGRIKRATGEGNVMPSRGRLKDPEIACPIQIANAPWLPLAGHQPVGIVGQSSTWPANMRCRLICVSRCQ